MPLLDKYGVALGIQNHAGRCTAGGMHLLQAVGKYDPSNVCAIWDAGHNGVEGEQVNLARSGASTGRPAARGGRTGRG